LVVLVCALPAALVGQYGVKTGDWTSFGGDNGSTRYSPLDQITSENVRNLQVAWTFKTDNYAPSAVPQSESTPIMAKGVLYFTAGPKRHVIASDAGSGETLWSYRFEEGVRGDRAPRKNTRGVSYWTDGREERIILVTPGFHLIALDAKTGQPVASFGKAGVRRSLSGDRLSTSKANLSDNSATPRPQWFQTTRSSWVPRFQSERV
jgi:quinoprotein glucose dehydrogenase